MLTDHPIIFIEKLLKLGLGDKGRLVYLRDHIKSGKTIYDSDKKFLNTLERKLDGFDNTGQNKSSNNLDSNNKFNDKIGFSGYENDIIEHEDDYSNNKIYASNEFDSSILKIQNSISELQQSNSRLKDNLELISISRESLPRSKMEKLTPTMSSSKTIKNNIYNSISLHKNNSTSTNLKIFGIKKHDFLAYASAGLFTLWYAGFQNIVDIGHFQSITLGLSAAAAVFAGILYRQAKIFKS